MNHSNFQVKKYSEKLLSKIFSSVTKQSLVHQHFLETKQWQKQELCFDKVLKVPRVLKITKVPKVLRVLKVLKEAQSAKFVQNA